MKSMLVCLMAFAAFSAGGCREADVTGPGQRPPGSGTYVVNEGGFGGGAQVDFYDPASGTLSRDVVRVSTPWLFPNDILVRGGMLYVAVNGSGMVSVVDPTVDSVVTDIHFPAGTAPGLLAAEGDWLYSANYDGTVSIIDARGDSVRETSAPVVGFPGAIVAAGGRIFVTDLGSWPDTGSNVMVLDGGTLAVLDSVVLGGGPAGLVAARGRLYAGAGTARKIYEIDPAALTVTDSAELDGAPGDLATDGISLFVLTPGSVERVPLATLEPDTATFIALSGGLYHYALGCDAAAGELYVSTITTGGGTGQVSIHALNGSRIAGPFAAGTFPGAFGFYRPPAP